ncbi:MAG: hypothetical protein BJ554DRAFT_4706 [Olpidium bornovanus]|uniref:MTHFR SAM-binding regulatory domain-containing protein n=1 Tax=Olpidium bornovanus TaxID=278681 RepID=A0A8H8DF19_9FUNG|nr:MAG: hypothetical protein BJ554DRAFT_4706 [Olpidium bornovanus]
MWKYPTSVDDICRLFADFCCGRLSGLPWYDQPLNPETDVIRQQLATVNLGGYLTINSQPAVNGVPSDDKVFGWGPKNGYVYQKAYLEFFVSAEELERLLDTISGDPMITYHAVNRQGDFRTNALSDRPNAVTWGVFPGKEIQQPTIVEAISFMAWKVSTLPLLLFSTAKRRRLSAGRARGPGELKVFFFSSPRRSARRKDEAFELWAQWAKIYNRGSPSAELIESIADSWFLVNVVHNDFQKPQAIFDIFETLVLPTRDANGDIVDAASCRAASR